MNEVMNYIFGSLKASEFAVRNINRTLKSQQTFNRNVAVFAVTTVVYIAAMKVHIRDQNEKIQKLRKEIEEMKKKGD